MRSSGKTSDKLLGEWEDRFTPGEGWMRVRLGILFGTPLSAPFMKAEIDGMILYVSPIEGCSHFRQHSVIIELEDCFIQYRMNHARLFLRAIMGNEQKIPFRREFFENVKYIPHASSSHRKTIWKKWWRMRKNGWPHRGGRRYFAPNLGYCSTGRIAIIGSSTNIEITRTLSSVLPRSREMSRTVGSNCSIWEQNQNRGA